MIILNIAIVFIFFFIGTSLAITYYSYKREKDINTKYGIPTPSYAYFLKESIHSFDLLYVHVGLAAIMTIVYVILFLIAPEREKRQAIEARLIEQHRIEKCPYCVWQNWGNLQYNPATNQYEGKYQWVKCDKLEKELIEELKSEKTKSNKN